MMKRPRCVRVLFARGIARTRFQRLLHWAIRTGSGSPIVHCAVASDGIAINASYADGVIANYAIDFARNCESLIWSIMIPVAEHPDVLVWLDIKRPKFRVLASALRWASCGLYPSRDCIDITARILRSVGVVVPRRITTPAGLFDWLRAQGYELHDIDKRPCSTRSGDWTGMCCPDPLA